MNDPRAVILENLESNVDRLQIDMESNKQEPLSKQEQFNFFDYVKKLAYDAQKYLLSLEQEIDALREEIKVKDDMIKARQYEISQLEEAQPTCPWK